MPNRFAYVLEHFEHNERATVVGIFSSLAKAEETLKTMRQDIGYTIYRLPLNEVLTEGTDLQDQQGEFDHWHYGTYEVQISDYDDSTGRLIDRGTEVQRIWRDEVQTSE